MENFGTKLRQKATRLTLLASSLLIADACLPSVDSTQNPVDPTVDIASNTAEEIEDLFEVKFEIKKEEKLITTQTRITDEEVIDYAEDKNILLFTDIHSQGGLTKKTSDYLYELKSRGYTTLALEVQDVYQSVFDQYLKSEGAQRTLAKDTVIDEMGDPSEKGLIDDIMEMADVAHSVGLNVICIDDYNSENMARKEMMQRDRRMKERLDRLVFEGERVVVFIGGAHVRTSRISYTNNPDIEEQLAGGTWIMYFTPLGHLLEGAYKDKVGFVDITGCNYEEVPYCTLDE